MPKSLGLMKAVSTAQRRFSRLGFLCLVAVAGCSSFDPNLLEPKTDPTQKPETDGGSAGTSTAGTSAGTGGAGIEADAAAEQDAAADGGGMGGMGGNGGSDVCYPNPDPTDQVCPVICPETCNNLDDDCNLKIDDNVPASECKLANAGGACNKGVCEVTECMGDFRNCDGKPENGCEAPRDDVNNCGQCGKKCAYVNGSGACMNDQCTDVVCSDGWDDCDANPKDCEQATNTLDNCTGCGLVCDDVPNASPSCDTGTCGPADCNDDFGNCDDKPKNGCEQHLNTNTHCGGCDTECVFAGATADCSTGTCLAEGCGLGFGECSGTAADGCESLNTPERCGGCTKKCNTELLNVEEASCADLTCTITLCADGFGDCDEDPQTGCETPLNTTDNCTDCKVKCERAHTSEECSTGTCQIKQPVVCDGGFADCNGVDADGCETNINSDAHCGGCNMPCVGGKTCSGGECSSVDCSSGTHGTVDCSGTRCANCDHSNDADCETDLDSDESNCGACGNECKFNAGVTQPHASAPTCAPTGCSIVCSAGYADCNNDYRDGCEASLSSTSHCDGCNKTCAIANAETKCTSFVAGHYVCEVATCDDDYADCDNNKTSCESALNTTAHCNSCNTQCDLDNAVNACTGSTGSWSCSIDACSETHFKNCNSTVGDGCEIDTRNSTLNCGACGNNCTTHANVTAASCATSACSYTCESGFKDCSAGTAGCETSLKTNTDCGDCGVMCSRTNATATCASGSCEIASCNGGFGNCDADSSNGCEPLTTIDNCGGCGTPCTTPNATGSCSTGSCTKTACNAGWGDCNGGLDCERDITAPGANETGGLGPCMPDTNCTRVVNPANNHEYYFCTTARSWADARARCQLQRNGDLVRIDNDAENTFVKNNVGADSWVGASDAVFEGAWRWSWGTKHFWNGLAAGAAVGGAYSLWNTGEPNDAGGEDCAQLIQAGANAAKWNDLPCANTLRFVCEVQDDLCPSDTTKQDPLQCGCGTADVHTDNDGFADCVDGCPSDANKSAAGQCGCGVVDVQTDADGVADCIDACPSDPNKSAGVGVCGCGVADTDTDADGVADCVDACDYDNTRNTVPCNFAYTPSNFDGTGIFVSAQNVSCTTAGTSTFSTTSIGVVTLCGTSITPVIRAQSGGPELWILPMNSLTVASGVTLRFEGTRPVVLAVANDATISGKLDVSAAQTTPVTTPGAGGNVSCAAGTGQGGDSVHDGDGNDGDGGGGGGGFGAAGGGSGGGHGGSGGGAAGVAVGNATLVPLRAGCKGGATPGGNVNGGGAGGGAIQLAVGGRITLASTAVITAAGSGGLKGGGDEEGGGGGGSGGAILLEGSVLSLDSNAWIAANGGGGAGGNATNNANGANGANGSPGATTQANGGGGGDGGVGLLCNNSDGGAGGKGGAQAGAATNGSNATSPSGICAGGSGGGGGGGGVGRIRIHPIQGGCGTPKSSPTAGCQ